MNTLNKLSIHAHWLPRMAIASVFIYHGLGKFAVLEQMAAMMGLPTTVLLLVASAESLGGVLVLLGGFLSNWATRLGAALLIPVMLGAISSVHWGQWSFAPSETHPMGGMEFQVTLALILSYLFIKGREALAPLQIERASSQKRRTQQDYAEVK